MIPQLERQIIELIAVDRIDIPISSMSGKLKRRKPKLAAGINLNEHNGEYSGERVYARVETEDHMKARGMRDAIDLFTQEFPRYGKILQGMIEEERAIRETHLYFGTTDGARLTADDYMGVMRDLGFSESRSRDLYPELMAISRNLSRKRDEERSVLLG